MLNLRPATARKTAEKNGARPAFSFLFRIALLIAVHSSASAETVKVVNFNTWGVPVAVPAKYNWRYREAMNSLVELNPDIIVLEEVFGLKGIHRFRNREHYPYEVRGSKMDLFNLKVLGSGLKVLSKYPILYVNSKPYKGCEADDCLANKGVLVIVIQLPSGAKLNVVATHLNARGDDSVRINQLKQMRTFIEQHMDPTAPVLISGDFNFDPTALAYQYLKTNLNLDDAWDVLHPNDPGITYDTHHNSFAYDYCTKHNFPLLDQRIDFMWTEHGSRLQPTESHLIFNDDKHIYSDHYGLWTQFELSQ